MMMLRAGIAGIVLLVAVAPSTATSVGSARGYARMPRAAMLVRRPVRRTPGARRRDLPSGCSSNYGTSGEFFVGIPSGTGDVAGAQDSGVAAGEMNEACDSGAFAGGGFSNIIGPATDEGGNSAIAGGEDNAIQTGDSFIGAGFKNFVAGTEGFVGGGGRNSASGEGAVVVGGDSLFVRRADTNVFGNQVVGSDSFVGAGDLNGITGNGSFIGAGDYTYAATSAMTVGNQIAGTDSFIGAGDQNSIGALAAFVGSGENNVVGQTAAYGFIGAGNHNTANGQYADVIGGYGNAATGSYAVVAGGDQNAASGTLSFSAGYHADAVHNGSFVWSDFSSGSAVVKDPATNTFVARASGGVYFYTNENASQGVKLGAGSGSWSSVSDRDAKTGVESLDENAILAKVDALPVTTWRYKTETGVRHLGPMAQDFYAAFGVGEDDRHITTIDEDGVALAAIKALHRQNDRLQAQNDRLQAKFASVERRLAALESRDRVR